MSGKAVVRLCRRPGIWSYRHNWSIQNNVQEKGEVLILPLSAWIATFTLISPAAGCEKPSPVVVELFFDGGIEGGDRFL